MKEKIVSFKPAYDKRNPNPNLNYGIGSVTCWMVLKGDKGAVQFAFMTAMYLPEVQEELKYKPEPMGMDVGYHSLVPQYEGQSKLKCDMFGECYYDGSSLREEEWFDIFLREGSDKIWEMLEDYYNEMFEESEAQNG